MSIGNLPFLASSMAVLLTDLAVVEEENITTFKSKHFRRTRAQIESEEGGRGEDEEKTGVAAG